MAQDQITAKVVGLDEFARGNRKLVENIGDNAETAFRIAGEKVALIVKARVPHLTGTLAGGVGVTSDVGGVKVGHIGGVPYAGFIEFGGRGRRRVPTGRYLYPTVKQAQTQTLFTTAAERAAFKAIEEMRWPKPT